MTRMDLPTGTIAFFLPRRRAMRRALAEALRKVLVLLVPIAVWGASSRSAPTSVADGDRLLSKGQRATQDPT